MPSVLEARYFVATPERYDVAEVLLPWSIEVVVRVWSCELIS